MLDSVKILFKVVDAMTQLSKVFTKLLQCDRCSQLQWLAQLLVFLLFPEIDMEGTIAPDTDPPQQMGDPNIEVCICMLCYDYTMFEFGWLLCCQVTEEMEEKASDERVLANMAGAEGQYSQLSVIPNRAHPKLNGRYFVIALTLQETWIRPWAITLQQS